MVAPLITGIARTGAQAGRKAGAAAKRPELLRRVRSRQRRAQREKEPLTEEEKMVQTQRAQTLMPFSRALHALTGGGESVRKIRATTATTLIMWTALPFYIPQALFWMVGLAGLGIETLPIVGNFSPGLEIFALGYFIAAGIGICSMFYAAWIYTIRGVSCFNGMKTFIFICCLTGYMVVFLNLFPWIVLWLLSVVLIKDDQ